MAKTQEVEEQVAGQQAEIDLLHEQMRSLQDRLKATEAPGGSPLRFSVGGPQYKSDSEIQKWLEEPISDHVFFFLETGCRLVLFHGEKRFSKDSGVETRLRPCTIQSQPWEGPGAELRDHMGNRLIKMDWTDLDNHGCANVKTPRNHGEYTVEQVASAIKAHKWYQPGPNRKIVPGKIAQRIIASQYKQQEATVAEMRRRAAMTAELTAEEVKAGQI